MPETDLQKHAIIESFLQTNFSSMANFDYGR